MVWGFILAYVWAAAASFSATAQVCETLPQTPVKVFRSLIRNDQIDALKPQPDINFQGDNTDITAAKFRIYSERLKQKMQGFGASMTESCAINLQRLPKNLRTKAMNDFFSKTEGAGFDYIRLTMGSSDFADGAKGSYSYDDSPNNDPDPTFKHFDMSRDEKSFKLIRQAKRINPNLKIMISPWTPPAWMKIPQSLHGGSLNPDHYEDYARYFVRVIKELQKRKIPVDSLTVQNEPGYAPDWYPSMSMSTDEQIRFIRDFLGPEMKKANLRTEIYVLDHNWDMYADVIAMLDDPKVKSSVSGVAYHCYGGDPANMEISSAKHPDIPILQTECSDILGNGFEKGFDWWFGLYTVAATNSGSTGSMAWNLCLDEAGGPMNNGCPYCRGVITTDFSKPKPELRYEPEFHAFAQVSRFIEPGTHRIEVQSFNQQGLTATAFLNPNNQASLAMWNPTDKAVPVHVQRSECSAFNYTMEPKSAVTFTWDEWKTQPMPSVADFR